MRIRGRGCKVVAPARIFSRYDESFLSFFFTTQRTSRLATGYNYKRARHAYSVPRVTRPPATIDDPTTAHIPSCLLSCLKVWEFRLVVSNEDFHLVGFPLLTAIQGWPHLCQRPHHSPPICLRSPPGRHLSRVIWFAC